MAKVCLLSNSCIPYLFVFVFAHIYLQVDVVIVATSTSVDALIFVACVVVVDDVDARIVL
jgi:hypothetical protein